MAYHCQCLFLDWVTFPFTVMEAFQDVFLHQVSIRYINWVFVVKYYVLYQAVFTGILCLKWPCVLDCRHKLSQVFVVLCHGSDLIDDGLFSPNLGQHSFLSWDFHEFSIYSVDGTKYVQIGPVIHIVQRDSIILEKALKYSYLSEGLWLDVLGFTSGSNLVCRPFLETSQLSVETHQVW